MDNLIELYCAVDDFMKIFWIKWSKTLLVRLKTSGSRSFDPNFTEAY